MHPFISIIIPCFNEEKFIPSLMENLMQQDYPADRMEVLIIDGQSSDNTQQVIKQYLAIYPPLKLLINEQRFVPFALNLGIKSCDGEVVVRMDAHSVYPRNYLSVLVESLYKLKADNVGGTWITTPANDSAQALAIALAQSSVFGVGDSLYRLGVKEITKVDTVPYGCYRRGVFDEIGFFDEELLRNQDDEFNARLIQRGGTIYLIPGVEIIYYARKEIHSLTRMFYQYGYFKPLVNLKLMRPATIRQFIPPLFSLFLLGGWMGAFISPILLTGYYAGVMLYLAINLLFSFKISLNHKKWKLMVLLPVIFSAQHLAYGIGYLRGFLNFAVLKKRQKFIQTSR